MKKILSTAVAVAALASAADAKGFNGFYAGMGIGMSALHSTFKVGDINNVASDRVHGQTVSPVLDIFLGYNKVFQNCFSVGGEFTSDFTFNNKKILSRIYVRNTQVKRDSYSWGLLAKFGMQFNQKTLAFIGLGVKSQNVKYIYSQSNPSGTSFAFSLKNNKLRPAYQIGFENLLPGDAVALRMAYTFVQGSKKSRANIASPNFTFINGKASAKNNEHLVKLGISYRF
ncbi:MAG: outer membrane beta-barrel protein [Candidatus Paracaedibacteraceae bacterium]|nr:outer membrane beta-barrel protein [Candidatus Paracaedibacteraceae bacterium]